MVRAVIKRLPFAVPMLRALRSARAAIPLPPRPAILMYHRVAQDSFDPWGLAVTPEHFDEQIRWLADNRTVLSLTDFAARQREGSLPDKAVAVTFDDAYACTARTAAPMLKALGMPATVFLPVELVESGRPFWWHELESLVLGFAGESLTVDGKPVALGKRRPSDEKWHPGDPPKTPRQRAFHRIWVQLRHQSPEEVERAMAGLREQAGAPIAKAKGPMTPAQVREAAAGGLIEFGSHALAHAPLPRLSAQAKAREIGESVERCAALAGSRPLSFAYPYGDHDSESEAMVEMAGFECACTTRRGAVTARSRVFALPRLAVGGWNARGMARALGSSS